MTLPPSGSCPITGCEIIIPRSMLMCRAHWFKVPYPLRREVLRTYRRGQEIDGNPSVEYVEAMTSAIQTVNGSVRDARA